MRAFISALCKGSITDQGSTTPLDEADIGRRIQLAVLVGNQFDLANRVDIPNRKTVLSQVYFKDKGVKCERYTKKKRKKV